MPSPFPQPRADAFADRLDVGLDTGVCLACLGIVCMAMDRGDTAEVRRALRVMSPDGLPIYEQSPTAPGAFLITCHSGVTLAAVHALSAGSARLLPRLLAYQFVVGATRNAER